MAAEQLDGSGTVSAREAWQEGYRQGVEDERTAEVLQVPTDVGAGRIGPARQNPYPETECTCEPVGPNYEGPWAGCDEHGMPSVAWRQGVEAGRSGERDVSALHWQHERDTLAARMQDSVQGMHLELDPVPPNKPTSTEWRKGYEAAMTRAVAIVQTKDTGEMRAP